MTVLEFAGALAVAGIAGHVVGYLIGCHRTRVAMEPVIEAARVDGRVEGWEQAQDEEAERRARKGIRAGDLRARMEQLESALQVTPPLSPPPTGPRGLVAPLKLELLKTLPPEAGDHLDLGAVDRLLARESRWTDRAERELGTLHPLSADPDTWDDDPSGGAAA